MRYNYLHIGIPRRKIARLFALCDLTEKEFNELCEGKYSKVMQSESTVLPVTWKKD